MTISDSEPKHPLVEVNAIIQNNLNKILFLKTKGVNTKESLYLPGGLVISGETVKEALKRVIREQACLEIEPIDILGIYSHLDLDRQTHIIKSVFVCIILGSLGNEQNFGSYPLIWLEKNKSMK